jgi:hypothetical protein
MRTLALSLVVLASCGSGLLPATDDATAAGATRCRRLVCGCTLYDPRTLEVKAELPKFAVVACSSEPALEASDDCTAAATIPCACASCDAAPE